ncbi:hypothetical protein A0H81_08435 [Grifola frondosa]|uniref:Septin-type G domain-containing protein n=1 Tax=Grifola frondosa TaxID=5627 RepID=A0A1C7M3A1_GRIFR|nr:hypothetical protein A0H81_08435 [Grifola frondosa]
MFSFRRKPNKKDTDGGPPFIRTSPSLPELSAQGISWPKSLVDESAAPPQGAARTSFPTDIAGPIPFHKPWSSPGKPLDGAVGGPISSLYMSHPPSAFEARKLSLYSHRTSQRRNRAPTNFNLMVAGAEGTGKTSLLRLLLDTADISPTATPEQKTAMSSFLHGPTKRTESIQAVCLEICESKYDRVLLTVVDTPGLDFLEGRELKLERQVSSIVKYLDAQFAETLSEMYLYDRSRVGHNSCPEGTIVRSYRGPLRDHRFPPSYRPAIHDGRTRRQKTDDDERRFLQTSRHRLSARRDVLLSDMRIVTDDTLSAIKRVVRRDLHAADLDFGVFGPVVAGSPGSKSPVEQTENGNGNGTKDHSDERMNHLRSVLRALSSSYGPPNLQGTLLALALTSRRSESTMEPSLAEVGDTESVASVRFSAHLVSKTDLSEHMHESTPPAQAEGVPRSPQERQSVHSQIAPSEDGHACSVADSTLTTPVSPSTVQSLRNFPYLAGPPRI